MAGKINFHETMAQREAPKGGSDRAFGIVFTVVFVLIGCWPLLFSNPPRIWSLAVAAVFLGLAFLYPRALAPLNALWTRFGLLLHRVVNPLILGLIFYVVITPSGLLRQWLRRDPLNLDFDREAKSYWIEREPGPSPESMKRQF